MSGSEESGDIHHFERREMASAVLKSTSKETSKRDVLNPYPVTIEKEQLPATGALAVMIVSDRLDISKRSESNESPCRVG